jgi:hypothetical protein
LSSILTETSKSSLFSANEEKKNDKKNKKKRRDKWKKNKEKVLKMMNDQHSTAYPKDNGIYNFFTALV